MAAEKRNLERDPHDPEMIDEVTERVFKDYEPPKKEQEINGDESDDEAERLAA